MRILHISTHLGGGIGNALSSIVCADKINESHIVLLEKPVKMNYFDRLVRNGNLILCVPDEKLLTEQLEWADIVIFHWWHHPLMCKFMAKLPCVPVRSILWCHVSGCNYPWVSPELIKAFNYVLFTSPCSLDNPYWSDSDKKEVEGKSDCVYGMGQLASYIAKDTYEASHEFRIGYVGTLAKSKLHPMYIEMCSGIISEKPEVQFYLLGDSKDGEWIVNQAKNAGIDEHIHLVGYQSNVSEWLRGFDIFGYPLNPLNYATTENSILEAMSSGLPIVLMNQGTEKYIVDNGEDGLLADSTDDYVSKIITLVDDIELRKKIGLNAIKSVGIKNDFVNNCNRYQSALNQVYTFDKTELDLDLILGNTPRDWIKSAMNKDDRELFELGNFDYLPDIFNEENKSSIAHFERYYPGQIR